MVTRPNEVVSRSSGKFSCVRIPLPVVTLVSSERYLGLKLTTLEVVPVAWRLGERYQAPERYVRYWSA